MRRRSVEVWQPRSRRVGPRKATHIPKLQKTPQYTSVGCQLRRKSSRKLGTVASSAWSLSQLYDSCKVSSPLIVTSLPPLTQLLTRLELSPVGFVISALGAPLFVEFESILTENLTAHTCLDDLIILKIVIHLTTRRWQAVATLWAFYGDKQGQIDMLPRKSGWSSKSHELPEQTSRDHSFVTDKRWRVFMTSFPLLASSSQQLCCKQLLAAVWEKRDYGVRTVPRPLKPTWARCCDVTSADNGGGVRRSVASLSLKIEWRNSAPVLIAKRKIKSWNSQQQNRMSRDLPTSTVAIANQFPINYIWP